MFLSKDDLKLAYGVDMQIGEAYVNRVLPEGNLYWKNRKIYIPESPGYYFMPIFSDLLLRHGVPKDMLLHEKTFFVAEQILHAAALLEYEQCTWHEHIAYIHNVLINNVVNHGLYKELSEYLDVNDRPIEKGRFGTRFPSLNRADSYLFLLVTIPPGIFDLEGAIGSWYAMMTYFLILDDLVDIKDDLREKAENAFVEAGLDDNGIKLIEQMIHDSYDSLLTVNPVLANRIDHKRKTMDLTNLIRSILSE